jgi:hypothetical protein
MNAAKPTDHPFGLAPWNRQWRAYFQRKLDRACMRERGELRPRIRKALPVYTVRLKHQTR